MTRVTVTMLDEQRRALRALLFRDDLECATIVLCGTSSNTDPWAGTQQQRFFVRQVVDVPLKHFDERTADSLTWSTTNRLAHFYLIPVVDLGLSIEPDGAGGYSTFDGRVTVVQPGYPCQHCRNLIDPARLLAESQRRTDPVLYRERRREGYVVGEPDPSPVVVTFTTELAAVAVNEVFQRLTGYRTKDGWCSERVRRFHEVKDSDTVPAGQSKKGCPLCDCRKFDGLGDVEPFLDQA